MLAIDSQKWLEMIQIIPFDSHFQDLVKDMVVLELDERYITLGIDVSMEETLNEYSVKEITRAIKSHYQKKNAQFQVHLSTCNLQCINAREIEAKRKQVALDRKISDVKSSEIFQIFAEHFETLKVLECQEIKEESIKEKTKE